MEVPELNPPQQQAVLHGDAPLCATYLAAAGLGTLLVTGPRPELAAHDPAFTLASAEAGAEATLVLDLGDGRAYAAARGPRLWGGVDGPRVHLGVEPRDGAPAEGAARALLETLAAGEALWRVLGHDGHVYEF